MPWLIIYSFISPNYFSSHNAFNPHCLSYRGDYACTKACTIIHRYAAASESGVYPAKLFFTTWKIRQKNSGCFERGGSWRLMLNAKTLFGTGEIPRCYITDVVSAIMKLPKSIQVKSLLFALSYPLSWVHCTSSDLMDRRSLAPAPL